jgi:hypothetical protein
VDEELGGHSGAVLGGQSLVVGSRPKGEDGIEGWRLGRLEAGFFDDSSAARCGGEATME